MKEKERLKEESKRLKKLESNFKNLLRELNINYELSWEEVKAKIENEEEFLAFDSESERTKAYKVESGRLSFRWCVLTWLLLGFPARDGRIVQPPSFPFEEIEKIEKEQEVQVVQQQRFGRGEGEKVETSVAESLADLGGERGRVPQEEVEEEAQKKESVCELLAFFILLQKKNKQTYIATRVSSPCAAISFVLVRFLQERYNCSHPRPTYLISYGRAREGKGNVAPFETVLVRRLLYL